MSCYHHCDQCASGGDLQCWLTIIQSWPQQLSWAVPLVCSMWWLCLHHRSTSNVTQQETSELWYHLTCSVVSGMLCFFLIGSDKLDCYIFSLRIARNSHTMAMPPPNSLNSRSIKRNDNECYDNSSLHSSWSSGWSRPLINVCCYTHSMLLFIV